MDNYKFLYKESYDKTWQIKKPPNKPERYLLKSQQDILLPENPNPNEKSITLLDLLKHAIKNNCLLEDTELSYDKQYDESYGRITLYKREENSKYMSQLLQYQEDMLVYQQEMLIYEKCKKAEFEAKLTNEREAKKKLLDKLKAELGE